MEAKKTKKKNLDDMVVVLEGVAVPVEDEAEGVRTLKTRDESVARIGELE